MSKVKNFFKRLGSKSGANKKNKEVSKERKEMTIIEIVELNEYGVRVEEQDHPLPFYYFDDNGVLPDGNYDEYDDIAGTWVVVSGRHEIGTFAYSSIDDFTLVKEKDFRNYLIRKLKYNEEEVEELLENVKEKTRYERDICFKRIRIVFKRGLCLG